MLLSYDHAWAAFKRHTVIFDNQEMRDRINCLIDNVADDPCAIENRYNKVCWLKHMRTIQKMLEDDSLSLMQNVTFREAHAMFYDHVRKSYSKNMNSDHLKVYFSITVQSFQNMDFCRVELNLPTSKKVWFVNLVTALASIPVHQNSRVSWYIIQPSEVLT